MDGGRTFPLRLTEELDSDSGSFLWRVPGLFSDQASLALRIGIDGEETLTAPGPIFRLRSDPVSGKAMLRWRSGEIWLANEDEREQAGAGELPCAGLSAAPERLTALPREAGAALPARSFGVEPGRRPGQTLRSSLRETPESPGLVFLSRTPLTIPQRI